MKRICHVVQSFYPRDPRVRRQAEALVEAGYEVDVICLRGTKEKAGEVVNGVRVTRVPLTRRRGSKLRYLFEYAAFFCLAFLILAVRARRYQVIQINNMPDVLVFSATIPKLFGAKLLLDEHDPMPELFMLKYHLGKDSAVFRFLRFQERHSVRFAHHVLTVNDAMKERLEAVADDVPVSSVMNLPESKLFRPVDGRWSNDTTDGKFVLLFAGTVSSNYDLAMVIQSMPELCSRVPGVRLKIAGDGDDIPALRRLSEELSVNDVVEFCGFVPFDQVPKLMADSDLGISTLRPSVIADLCFYTKTAEYAMVGLPSVAATARVVRQFYPDGIVHFFDMGDKASFVQAVTALYENPAMRRDMSRRGIEFSRNANWSVEKQKYVDLMGILCDSGRRAG